MTDMGIFKNMGDSAIWGSKLSSSSFYMGMAEEGFYMQERGDGDYAVHA